MLVESLCIYIIVLDSIMRFSSVGKSSRLPQLVISQARSSIYFLFHIIFFYAITKPWSFTFPLIDIYIYLYNIFELSFFPFHFNFFPFSYITIYFCPLLESLQVPSYYNIRTMALSVCSTSSLSA